MDYEHINNESLLEREVCAENHISCLCFQHKLYPLIIMIIESFLSGHCQTIEIFTKYQSVEACTSISALWSLPNLIDIN